MMQNSVVKENQSAETYLKMGYVPDDNLAVQLSYIFILMVI